MTKPRTVEFNGETLTITELSRRTGLSYCCLSDRYGKGDRGEKLVRPAFLRKDKSGGADCVNPELARMRDESEQKRVSLRAKHEQRQQVLQRRKEMLAAKKAEHAAAFARPLIDAALLAPAERKRIRERVSHSAQRTWRQNGGTM